MGLEWADEQTLRWPIQDLQPWANRAASDGPMKGQCIRAIWEEGWQCHGLVDFNLGVKPDSISPQTFAHLLQIWQ